jgi:electron transfer flavoprotein alpha subunit
VSTLVVVEHRNDLALDGYREAVAAARKLGEAVVGLVVGANAAQIAETLVGCDEIVAVRTPAAEHEVEREIAAVTAVARARDITAIVALGTATVLGWAAAAAIRLDSGYVADVVELRADGDTLVASKGLYGGKVIAEFELARGSVILIRPATFAPGGSAPAANIEVVERDDPSRTAHLGFREKAAGDVDITQADFLLAIGRGVGDKENIDDFEELAKTMGATLAVSRPIVDAGWVGDGRQVGQSGKTVSPRVYLAFGISGAVQHLAGIKSADTIIAVNTDPSAAIFSIAHYGTTVDMFDLAEALAEAWTG